MQMYYNQWKLDINYDKTKLLVVGERINIQRYVRIENYMIEILNESNILDLYSTKNESFPLCKSMLLIKQGSTVLVSTLKLETYL